MKLTRVDEIVDLGEVESHRWDTGKRFARVDIKIDDVTISLQRCLVTGNLMIRSNGRNMSIKPSASNQIELYVGEPD